MKVNPSQLLDLIQDSQEFAILVALDMFSSLNLKKISILTGISESTALRKIRDLLGGGHITLDIPATTEKRGKYYNISDNIENILTHQIEDDSVEFNRDDFESLSELEQKQQTQNIISVIQALSSLAELNSSMVQVFSQHLVKILNSGILPQKEKLFLTMSMMNFTMETLEKREEFGQYLQEFMKKIKKFETPKGKQKKGNFNFYIAIYPIGDIDEETP
ncbi:MAG: hypothetical protein ACTSRK_12390 [Promethearchaeota archaeon]